MIKNGDNIMAEISELVLDIFDILKETQAKPQAIKTAMFDILVSFEDHEIMENPDRDLENCRHEDSVLDEVIDEFFDYLDNPTDFEDEDADGFDLE